MPSFIPRQKNLIRTSLFALLLLPAMLGGRLLLFPTVMAPHRWLEFPSLGRCSERLNRSILDQSLALGTRFLLNNQKSEGNFYYEYDWIARSQSRRDNQVRQAGAMWGLALIYQDQPSRVVGDAVERAMAFFRQHACVTEEGERYVVYPDMGTGSMGTVALCALSYIDYLRGAGTNLPEARRQQYRGELDGYLRFLVSARTPDGRWHRSYRFADGTPYGPSSPYADGEALLALVKAARYLDKTELLPVIMDAAQAGYRLNVRQALRQHPDSATTKGYYQWSSMAFYELATSGWPNTERYGDYLFSLADWMIDVHRTLTRTRNTGYAYEGILHAYALAREWGDVQRTQKYACVIDTGLEKLISWQVGGPIPNRFLRNHPTSDPAAVGGIMNHRREPPLRIDVTQHQMHAIILARRYCYR